MVQHWSTGAAPAPTDVKQVLGVLKHAPPAATAVMVDYARVAERMQELTQQTFLLEQHTAA
jgi:hypothetical protein